MQRKTQRELIDGYYPKLEQADAWQQACDDLRVRFGVRTSYFRGIKYDTKTDRYVGTWEINKQPCQLKLTTEVAMFVLEAVSMDRVPTDFWLKMNDDGEVYDCLLVSL